MVARAQSNTVSAHVGTVGTRVRETANEVMERAKGKTGTKVLWVAGLAAAIVPVVGLGAQWALEHVRNSKIANDQKYEIAKHQGFGSVKALENAARRGDPLAAGIVDKINKSKADANRMTNFSSAGAAGVGMMTGTALIPGASAVTNMLATEGLRMGGSVAGGAVSTMFNKDQLEQVDMQSMIEGKKRDGQQVTAYDILMLRISQDAQWQQAFKKKNGHAFHKLDMEAQQRFMTQMPELWQNARYTQLANAINTGTLTPQQLPLALSSVNDNGFEANDNQPGSWANRVGGPRGARGSFVQSVNAQRAAAVNDNTLA